MPLPRFASIPLPIVVSLFLHATAAASLVVAKSGHHRSSTELSIVEIDTIPPDEVPIEPEEETAPEPTANVERRAAPHDHTHPYPVPENHDARPHDPSLAHDHEEPPAPASPEPVVAAAERAPALPRFTIAMGNSPAATVAAARVATHAHGGGSGANVAPSAAAADTIVPASGVHVAARLVAGSTAAYPAGARADEVEGDVTLEIVVDVEGRVMDARVVRSAGHGFDESALVAIKRYRFSPAQVAGRAVRVRMPWTVQFRLR